MRAKQLMLEKILGLFLAFSFSTAFAAGNTPLQLPNPSEPGLPKNPPFYGKQMCYETGFHCVQLRPTDTWSGLWPNHRERDIIMRLNRSNVELKYRKWVVVPNDVENMTSMSIAPFPLQIFPPKQKEVVVNLNLQAYGAYNSDGKLIFWGPATEGKSFCPDENRACPTPTGVFRVFRKGGEDCISHSFPIVDNGGSPMPYCMFFHGGSAIHGAEVPGIPSSHGCVGVYDDDARWLNENFVDAGVQDGTTVIVLKY